jgi:hypothetical protein
LTPPSAIALLGYISSQDAVNSFHQGSGRHVLRSEGFTAQMRDSIRARFD